MKRLLTVGFVFLVGLATGLAQDALDIEDVLGIRAPSDAQWSPDGGYVYFSVSDWDREKNRRVDHVHRVETATGESIQLTRGEKGEGGFRLSPDGSQLAFRAERGEKTQVWVLPLAGGEAFQLTDEEYGAGAFAWSPDSKSIAFVTRDVPEDLKEQKKKKEDKFDAVRVDRDFSWSHLWVVDLASREKRRLTMGEFNVSDPQWSPQGDRIAYAVDYNGSQASPWRHIDDEQSTDLAMVFLEGGETADLTPGPGRASSPRWSPSGDHLAFAASTGLTRGDRFDVMLLDLSTRELRNLTESDPEGVSGAEWSRDGQYLYYGQAKGLDTLGYRVDLSTGRVEEFFGKPGLGGCGFEVSPDGRNLVFCVNDLKRPDDLFAAELDGSNARRLTDLNPDLATALVGESRAIEWKSPDGTMIQGILTLPVGYQQGKRYPLILSIHGGPTGHYPLWFRARNQVFAGQGYAILEPNPRGSTGRGLDFIRANREDWGGKDFHDDDLSGVDAVIAMGVADPEKLVVMGGSYGGFSTFWAVTQTDRFKAAIAHAAISDWYSFYGQTDIPQYLHWGFGGHPWESRPTYEKFSPYNFAQQVMTPLMITHGEEDRRVPISQAEQYYTLLKKLGREVEFVRYPREGHGIREPNHIIDLVGRQLEWFDRHLGIERKVESEAPPAH